MTAQPLTVHMMTATLSPGDAIGNYILTSARIWRDWGARVEVYADNIAPELAGMAKPASWYAAGGQGILWYHYSIYAENLALVSRSSDFKVMDFHGVAPPHLFARQNAHLRDLCQKGLDLLPRLRSSFDLCVAHSDYASNELVTHGYPSANVLKLPLCVDTTRFDDAGDAELSEHLERLEYFLFVGRIVPQKDLLALVEIFAHIHKARPDAVLMLVGSRHLASNYQRQLDRAVEKHALSERVLFTGQVNNTAVLASLFRHAKLLFVTSEWESFCVPIVEAAYFGVPAVIHNLPPLPEIAGEGGLRIDKHRPLDAAEAVLSLLEDEARYQQLRQAAISRSANYTDRALVRALMQTLRFIQLETYS